MVKKTVGKIATELKEKQPETLNPIELQREMQKEYIKELTDCALSFRANNHGDFFIVVLTKNEKLLDNVFRNYFFARKTCPTPDYDQSVWKYDAANEQIHFIWVIPSREASFHLKENALQVVPEEQVLLQFVLQFADGTLYKLCKKLNGESDTNLLVKGNA